MRAKSSAFNNKIGEVPNMVRAAKRIPHTCQYGKPCKACKKSGLIPVGSNTQASMRKAMERTRNYRGQEAIESVKLPRHMPGADGYGPNGEPRFKTRNAYKEAGRRAGLVWQ